MSKTIATSNGLMAKTTKMTKAAPQSNTQRGTKGDASEPERVMARARRIQVATSLTAAADIAMRPTSVVKSLSSARFIARTGKAVMERATLANSNSPQRLHLQKNWKRQNVVSPANKDVRPSTFTSRLTAPSASRQLRRLQTAPPRPPAQNEMHEKKIHDTGVVTGVAPSHNKAPVT